MRINAEDPDAGLPAGAGDASTRFRPPLGPGVRLDTFLEEGLVVPPFYDSLLAKLVVWDEDRPSAIARALRALGELELEGMPTTREAAIDILSSEEFASGRVLDRLPRAERRPAPGAGGLVSPDGFSVTNAEGTVSITVVRARPRDRRRRRSRSTARACGGRGAGSTWRSRAVARASSLVLAARHGVVLPGRSRASVQERVAGGARVDACGLGVARVDVTVEEIL